MKLQLYYAVKPMAINQGFGVNESYYSKFKDQFGNPWKGHNGIDFKAPHATPLYAACDGMARYLSDTHGGDGIYIRTAVCDYGSSQAYFWIVNWHMCSKDDTQFKPLIPTDGKEYPVKAGDLLGYTDNTGAPYESSGDHLHFALIPKDPATNVDLEAHNGFDGCIDPTPYFTGKYAQDINAVSVILQSANAIVQHIASSPVPASNKFALLGEIGKVVQYLEGLI